MFRRFFVLAALPALLSGAALAKDAAPEFSAQRFRAHVDFLSNDLLEGRDSGSRGYDIAAAYVASRFEALGLQPAGEDGGWYVTVPLRAARLAENGPSLTIEGSAGSRAWGNLSDVIIGPSTLEREQDIAAPVVFVGYGLEAPELRIDDYRGLDVRGKVVALLSGAPEGIASETAAHLASEKGAVAARHGAIGIIQLETEVSAAAFPWDLRLRHAGAVSMTWIGKDGKPLDEAPGLRFSIRVDDPAAEALFAGSRKSYAAVRAEASRQGNRLKGFPLKARIRFQRTSVWTDTTSRNVVGKLPGSDPGLREEYVVLMGHLDHLGVKKDAKPGEDAVYNGALDNAAGIATMIEAARAFATTEEKPRRSLLFIANTAEEKGLLGADYFAHNPVVPIGSIAAAVDLDMPLLLYPFTDVIAFGAEHSTVGEAVAAAAESMNLGLSPDPMPEENVFVRSDHYMFVKQGIPAIMLATGFANGGEAQWRGFLAGNYHSVADDVSQPILWQEGAKFARLNYLIARRLANADERPRWYQGDFFGELYAPAAPKVPPPGK